MARPRMPLPKSSPDYRHDSIVFTSEPDMGLYDGVVKGFAKATGEVVAYLNAGDIFHEHAFRVVSEVMTHEGSGLDLRLSTQDQ